MNGKIGKRCTRPKSNRTPKPKLQKEQESLYVSYPLRPIHFRFPYGVATITKLQLPLLPGPGPSSSPMITLNSLLAGSLFLPATFDTNTLNSYLDPLSSPVTLYSCPVILFLEFQCTNLPSELGLLYSISYLSWGSPPSWGGRVHFSMKLVAFSNVIVLVMLNGPLGGPVFERKFRTFLL